MIQFCEASKSSPVTLISLPKSSSAVAGLRKSSMAILALGYRLLSSHDRTIESLLMLPPVASETCCGLPETRNINPCRL
jgi:hypothetical protein